MTPRSTSAANPSQDPAAPTRLGAALRRWADHLAPRGASQVPGPLRAPRAAAPERLRAPRERWLDAFLAARRAVRAGVPLEDFLRHRLARRMGALPVPPERLPATLAVEDGAAVARARTAPVGRAPWIEAYLREHGQAAVGPDLQLSRAALAMDAARIDAQRARVEALRAELARAAEGAEPADPADDEEARRLGRPPVPRPLGLGLQLFALALLLAEAWQLALPCLDAAGVRGRDLAAELQRDPLSLVPGALFALGATLGLFVLAHLALRRGGPLARGSGRGMALAVATSSGALAATLGLCFAAGPVEDVGPAHVRVALGAAALAVPVTAAWLARLGRAMEAARALRVEAARAWDVAHYRAYAVLSRGAAHLAAEERELKRLEAVRAAEARHLEALQRRAAQAERRAADAAGAEAYALARVVQGVVAGLELDRFEYLRQAGQRAIDVALQDRAVAPEHKEAVGRNLGLAG